MRAFRHFVSYGSTDQQTVRDLSAYFDGLLVPGTIAAFQAEGTKGFVLTLSARSPDPYAIDSRFPLFQNLLAAPKKSHVMLAEVLGVPELVNSERRPLPSDVTAEQSRTIAENWIEFNLGYDDVQSKTFDKYAARLNEQILPEARQLPAFIMPPYTIAHATDDAWWGVSEAIWNAAVDYSAQKGVRNQLRRVIAASDPIVWGELAARVSETELIGWVSGLDEFSHQGEQRLLGYGQAISAASGRGQSVFALYGGFFSVLLARYGLVGSSHGIGFGEHRDWVELPSSGAPPARYYVPRKHRYLGVDIAMQIWEQFPELISCDCSECERRSPASLDYHALMRHSLLARDDEIKSWLELPTEQVLKRLRADAEEFKAGMAELMAPARIRQRAQESFTHLWMWARVLEELG